MSSFAVAVAVTAVVTVAVVDVCGRRRRSTRRRGVRNRGRSCRSLSFVVRIIVIFVVVAVGVLFLPVIVAVVMCVCVVALSRRVCRSSPRRSCHSRAVLERLRTASSRRPWRPSSCSERGRAIPVVYPRSAIPVVYPRSAVPVVYPRLIVNAHVDGIDHDGDSRHAWLGTTGTSIRGATPPRFAGVGATLPGLRRW